MGPRGETERRRLGQYFTPDPVAALAAASAVTKSTRRVIDPMAGGGAMLRAVHERAVYLTSTPVEAVAIEIDAAFKDVLAQTATAVIGDAFAVAPRVLATGRFDAVIGNPPYVRYEEIRYVQSDETLALRNAVRTRRPGRAESVTALDAIRSGLIASVLLDVDSLDAAAGVLYGPIPGGISEMERRWIRHVQALSGRVDLYLPAWMLTWPLLAEGGRVAFVTSTAWRSRRYGEALGSFLADFYTPVIAIEQEGPTWFGSAQVPTSLVVLEKRSKPETPTTSQLRTLHIPKHYFLATEDGVAALARDLDGTSPITIARAADTIVQTMLRGESGPWKEELHELRPRGPERTGNVASSMAPAHSGTQPPSVFAGPGFDTLADIGVSVHQGLRTGFNPFFYIKDGDPRGDRIEGEYLVPVVHQQAELDAFVVNADQLKTRLLHTGYGVHADDYSVIASYPIDWVKTWRAEYGLHVLPPGVAEYIAAWTAVTVDRPAGPLPVRDLSAVAPNGFLPRVDAPGRPEPPRFWYRIVLRDRHRPDVFVPRIIDSRMRAYWNVDRQAVVDANFSTLLCPEDRATPCALTAFLHSTWFRAMAEATGTPLGGGALKLEAAHIRTITVPRMSRAEWETLDRLGASNATTHREMVEAVDQVVLEAAARALSIRKSRVSRTLRDTVTRHIRRRKRAA